MNIYVFTSKNLTNIWAGIGARRWAVSEAQGDMSSSATKASQISIGSFGLLYCVETKALTTPFVIYSRPEAGVRISGIWPEEWVMPFRMHPLGTPELQLRSSELRQILPCLRNAGLRWDQVFHFQPVTVFSPSQIGDDDWEVLMKRLTPQPG